MTIKQGNFLALTQMSTIEGHAPARQPQRKRALIADDSSLFRQAARALLERRGYEVVGEADTAAVAITLAQRLMPSVALLDVGLPDSTGYELAVELKQRCPHVAILLTSAEHDSLAYLRAAACGSRGCVPTVHLARCDLGEFWPRPR